MYFFYMRGPLEKTGKEKEKIGRLAGLGRCVWFSFFFMLWLGRDGEMERGGWLVMRDG